MLSPPRGSDFARRWMVKSSSFDHKALKEWTPRMPAMQSERKGQFGRRRTIFPAPKRWPRSQNDYNFMTLYSFMFQLFLLIIRAALQGSTDMNEDNRGLLNRRDALKTIGAIGGAVAASNLIPNFVQAATGQTLTSPPVATSALSNTTLANGYLTALRALPDHSAALLPHQLYALNAETRTDIAIADVTLTATAYTEVPPAQPTRFLRSSGQRSS